MRLILISLAITIVAWAAIIAHIMMPTMMIDNITLGLLLIAIVPWFVPIIKSIKWGSLELQLQDRLERLEKDAEKMHADMESMTQTLKDLKQGITSVSRITPKRR